MYQCLPTVTQWGLYVNFARSAGQNFPAFLQLPTAQGSFTCMARSTRAQHAFWCYQKDQTPSPVSLTGHLEDKVQCWAWIEPGSNPGPSSCGKLCFPVFYMISWCLAICPLYMSSKVVLPVGVKCMKKYKRKKERKNALESLPGTGRTRRCVHSWCLHE